jgi:hypothetical protein
MMATSYDGWRTISGYDRRQDVHSAGAREASTDMKERDGLLNVS